MKKLNMILIISLSFILLNCATSPRILYMVPPVEEFNFVNTNKSISVNYSYGGQESDPIFEGSKIDNASFTGALITALNNSNLFSEINPSGNAYYNLSALILSQNQPMLGFDMTVTLLVRYTLTRGVEGTEVWQKDVLSSYTATVGDAFVGATRLKLANEGVVRENIKMLLEYLSQLNL